MSSQFPNDVVGVEIPIRIGELDGNLKVQSFEPQFSTTYKPNTVTVRGSIVADSDNRGFPGGFRFTVTEKTWKELNRAVRERGGSR